MSGRRNNGEGIYTPRPNGTWQFRIRVNGHRVSGTGPTKTAAKAVAMERAALVGERKTTDTVSDLFDKWRGLSLDDRGVRATTADQYVSLIRTHVIPTLGDVRADRLTKRQVADLLDGMTGAASTRRSTYAALAKLMDYAEQRGYVSRNVVRDVPRPKTRKAAPRDATAADAAALLSKADGHRWAVAAHLAFGCGLRRGEILGLKWTDIDWTRGVLTVTGNVTRSSAGLVRGRPKNDRGVRQTPIPAPTLAALKAHRKAQSSERLAATFWHDTGLVLTNEVGGAVDPRNLSRAWRGWASQAGLSDTGMHLGRHFAASALLSSGQASAKDVADMIGHDPSVLLNTYANAVAAGQRAAADALGDALIAAQSGAHFGAHLRQDGPNADEL